MERKVNLINKGLIDYKECWDFQEDLFKKTVNQKIEIRDGKTKEPTSDHLIFCEHPHVYTLGKSGDQQNLLIAEDLLRQINAQYYKINRGGDITYHGPGQLVMYPIFDLDHFFTDIHKYMRYLEEAVILTLGEFGIKAGRVEGLTGVWLDGGTDKERKICAMGVKSSRWVTMHGFALNVNANLGYFDNIVPCGIKGKAVTSLNVELGVEEVSLEEVKQKILKHFSELFEAKLV